MNILTFSSYAGFIELRRTDTGGYLRSLIVWCAGSRFQAARNAGKEKDVATKHEDQADCSRHNCCTHSHHNPVRVPWIQVQVRAAWSRYIQQSLYYLLLLLGAKTIWCSVLSLVCSGPVRGAWGVFTSSVLGCLLNVWMVAGSAGSCIFGRYVCIAWILTLSII